jgi:hypothetical protein
MDRRERAPDLIAGVMAAMEGAQAGLWTSVPAVVTRFNAARMTVEALPAVQGRVTRPDKTVHWRNLPLLVDCPVVFPGGGGFTLTFPVSAGDECLIVIASRCIDTWWSTGGGGEVNDLRMHDLSDGFAIMGIRSLPRALVPAPSSGAVELRSDDGATRISMTPGTITITGDVVINGTLTNNGKDVGSGHRHDGVRRGTEISNPPI